MKISELFQNKSCVFSIECFPPKQTTQFAAMQQTLRRMKELSPDFISVTYGAGGSAGGVSTVEVANFLQEELGILPLAHIICMGSDKALPQLCWKNYGLPASPMYWSCAGIVRRCARKARTFTMPAI